MVMNSMNTERVKAPSARRVDPQRLVLGAVGALVVVLLLAASTYYVGLVAVLGVHAIVVIGLGFLMASGQISLGHAAFVGLGAYGSALLSMRLGMPVLLAIPCAVLLCTLVGYAIFNRLLAQNRSAAVVPWVLLAPVVAMISAALLLCQIPNLWETIGGLTLVLGVLFANLPVGRAERPRVDPHGAPPLVPDVDERRGVRA